MLKETGKIASTSLLGFYFLVLLIFRDRILTLIFLGFMK
jgi:hypothetical protein